MTVALFTVTGSGIRTAATRELRAQGWNRAILSPFSQGGELGGFGVTGSNASEDDLRRPGYGGRTVAA